MHDVIVSGAGPSGSLAARLCAQFGLDTVLLESSNLLRPKCCAGGLLGRAMNEIGCEIPTWIIQSELRGFTINLAGKRYIYRFGSRAGITVMREELDSFLASLAVNAGASLLQSTKALDIESDEKGVRVATSGGQLRSKYFIIAEGARSRSAVHIFGPRAVRGMMTGLIIECEGAQDDEGLVHFYPWLESNSWRASAACFPKRGDRATVTLFGRNVRRDELLQKAEEILRSNCLTPLGSIHETAAFHPIPVEPRPHLKKGNVLLVGDAAGLASGFSGEGLTNAFKSARIAASMVAASMNGDQDRGVAGYDAAMHELLSKTRRSVEIGSVIMDWLKRPSGGRILCNLQTERALVEGCGDFVRGDIGLAELAGIALPRLPRLLR